LGSSLILLRTFGSWGFFFKFQKSKNRWYQIFENFQNLITSGLDYLIFSEAKESLKKFKELVKALAV
jgi:hypothetical protein